MIDEKDVEMSDAPIEMPPLDYQMPTEDAEAESEDNSLPPEIKAAQQFEREQAAIRAKQAEDAHQAPEVPFPQHTPQQIQETAQARNFRALKEAAEKAARERDELARKLQEYENQKLESSYEDFNVKDEDIVEGKQFAKAVQRIKYLEQQQKQYMQQTNVSAAEIKLRQQYPDFDKVVTKENCEMLSASYPELARSLNASSDLYEKAASAYTIIKKFGIYTDTPLHDADKKKAVANASKPRPTASVSAQRGETPLSRANAFSDGLTEELKEHLRKEMEECSKLY